MATIRQLLNQKGGKVCSIGPDATVFDAVAKMAENDIGSLTVMDSEALIGIITERRYARNVVLKGRHLHQRRFGRSWREMLSPWGRNNPSKNAWR